MNKELTPMARCKSNFQDFKSEVKNIFNEVSLNKSRPSHSYTYGQSFENKGVSNDFVLIFQNKNIGMSFSFIFTYKNLKEEDHFVLVQIKKGKDNKNIISSPMMSVKEFNGILKTVVSELKSNPPISVGSKGVHQVIDLVAKNFFNNDLSLGQDIKSLGDEINQRQSDLVAKKENLNKVLTEKKQKIKSLDDEINSLKEFKELNDIEAKINKLRIDALIKKDFIEKYKKDKMENLGINKLTEVETKLKTEIEFSEKFLGVTDKQIDLATGGKRMKVKRF